MAHRFPLEGSHNDASNDGEPAQDAHQGVSRTVPEAPKERELHPTREEAGEATRDPLPRIECRPALPDESVEPPLHLLPERLGKRRAGDQVSEVDEGADVRLGLVEDGAPTHGAPCATP